MKVHIQRIVSNMKSSFWLIPSLMALLGVLLGYTAQKIDIYFSDLGWSLTDAAGARAILTTIAASSITVAGVVFSITMVVLSSASTQFGPRLMRNFVRHGLTKIVLGGYIGIFIYCIMVISTVRDGDGGWVPQLSVTLGGVFGLLSFGLLILFIHHVTQFLQAPRIINQVAIEIEKGCSSIFPLNALPDDISYTMKIGTLPSIDNPSIDIINKKSGYLQAINLGFIYRKACDNDAVIRIHNKPGNYLLKGERIASVWKSKDDWENIDEEINNAVLTGCERTETQDIEFTFDQLVEVAVRALSPGINDPFTAINCIHKLSSSLVLLLNKGLPGGMVHDEEGKLRIALETYSYDGLIDAAFYQIRQHSKSNESVSIELMKTYSKLCNETTHLEFLSAINKHARLLLEDCELNYQNTHDLEELKSWYNKVYDNKVNRT